jgi:hypothetical protein
MSMTKGPAAPASGTTDDIPDFATLAADPEIEALLDFEPVPVRKRVNGWDADAQRAFVALLAITGSKSRAATGAGRAPAGIDRLLKRGDAAAFRAACEAALALFARNHGGKLANSIAAARKADPQIQAPGQLLNEFGEWEDEDSIQRRAEDARDSISRKLLNCRRLYLQEISGNAGKRAAFELLTGFPIDWDRAARLEPQEDEPWRKPNMREPEMLLTAENGWLGGMAHGPDKMAELRDAIDRERAEQGLDPVDWDSESTEGSDAGA